MRPVFAAAMLALCVLNAQAVVSARPQAGDPPRATSSTEQVIGDIATTPLQDANLKKREIPAILEQAAAGPYDRRATGSCRSIAAELAALNAALGPDFDAGADERGDGAGRKAAGVARGVVAGLIPFRGVIREVSGAAGAARRHEQAIDAGIARRGYLRGLAMARRCRRGNG
jgi:hypothetical protein